MVERAILTAGIVIFIIGGLAKLGESAAEFGMQINCAFDAGSSDSCGTGTSDETQSGAGNDNDSNSGETKSKRRTRTTKSNPDA